MPAQLSPDAIRDTVAAVFRAPEFNRPHSTSLLARFVGWLAELIGALRGTTAATPLLYRLLLGAAIAIIVAVVARAIWLAWLRRGASAPRTRRASAGSRAEEGDAWTLAQRSAAAGDFTAAAHHLYAAILEAAARRELVRLHPSKTIGDYRRELRARASQAVLGAFREFARTYEVVIYGAGQCDRERYERLRATAAGLVARDVEP